MKRMLIIISVVLLFAAVLLIWDSVLLRNAAQPVNDSQSGTREDTALGNMAVDTPDSILDNDLDSNAMNADQNDEMQFPQEASDSRTILRSEPVPVSGNTPEYEMMLTICEDSDLKVFLRLEYFQNGIGVLKELGEEQLPEITTVLESTSSQHNVINTIKFRQVLLNPVYGQLYMLISGVQTDEFSQTTLYRIDLADMAVDKLFSYPARYGGIIFNRDFSMLAYSFDDPPHMSVYQEDIVLEVYDCKKGEYLVKGNKDVNRQPIGINHSKGYLYDYEFMSWESLNIVRLKQGTREINNLDVKPIVTEVLYDIKKNLLMSSDGSEWKIAKSTAAETTDDSSMGDSESPNSSYGVEKGDSSSEEVAEDSENADGVDIRSPANVLKTFYAYLQSKEDYDKAMKLLDENFKLKMAMLRNFGVEEISKSDIDAEYGEDSMSLYSDLLKAAKLDTISKESIMNDGTAIITYYQSLGLTADSSVRQLMSAKLILVNNEYKIILIEDGIQ